MIDDDCPLPTLAEIEEMEWRITVDLAIVRAAYPNGLMAKVRECRERDRLAQKETPDGP